MCMHPHKKQKQKQTISTIPTTSIISFHKSDTGYSCCVCMHSICVNACMCEHGQVCICSTCGGQKTVLGVGPRFPPCLRQGLWWLSTVCARLAGPWASGGDFCFSLLPFCVYAGITDVCTHCAPSFYILYQNLNLGPHTCEMNAFTH